MHPAHAQWPVCVREEHRASWFRLAGRKRNNECGAKKKSSLANCAGARSDNIHRISETFLRTTHVSLGKLREVFPSRVPGSDKITPSSGSLVTPTKGTDWPLTHGFLNTGTFSGL